MLVQTLFHKFTLSIVYCTVGHSTRRRSGRQLAAFTHRSNVWVHRCHRRNRCVRRSICPGARRWCRCSRCPCRRTRRHGRQVPEWWPAGRPGAPAEGAAAPPAAAAEMKMKRTTDDGSVCDVSPSWASETGVGGGAAEKEISWVNKLSGDVLESKGSCQPENEMAVRRRKRPPADPDEWCEFEQTGVCSPRHLATRIRKQTNDNDAVASVYP